MGVREFWFSPPEGDGLVICLCGQAEVSVAGRSAGLAGSGDVASRVRLNRPERPTTSTGQDDAFSEDPAKGGDVGLEGFGRGTGSRVTPEKLDERVG
jgi:hypothetical protein